MTERIPTEREEAEALHKWLELHHMPHEHRANEGYGGRQGAIRQAMLKRQGLSKGAYDYEVYVPMPDGSLKLINIELKRQKGGTISPDQKKWEKIYTMAKIPNRVCKGWWEAKLFIEEIQENHVEKENEDSPF